MVSDEPPRLQKGSNFRYLLQHPRDLEEAVWWGHALWPATRDDLQGTAVLLRCPVLRGHPLKLLLRLEEVVSHLGQSCFQLKHKVIRLRPYHLLVVGSSPKSEHPCWCGLVLPASVHSCLILWLNSIRSSYDLGCGVVLERPRLHQRRSRRLIGHSLLRCGQGTDGRRGSTALHTRTFLPVNLLSRAIRRRLRHLALLLKSLHGRIHPVEGADMASGPLRSGVVSKMPTELKTLTCTCSGT